MQQFVRRTSRIILPAVAYTQLYRAQNYFSLVIKNLRDVNVVDYVFETSKNKMFESN
jgi:hypothetical protein